MSKELYKRYRPKKLSEVIGQDGAVKSIQKLLAKGTVPHAILLTGPSGVGKTTIARILKEQLHCSDNDFFERNCADFRGVDDVREIRRSCGFVPLGGRCRIWLIDECHKMTNDAQNALLKLLEDTPEQDYFMLATTEPQKLIRTIHTRCTQVKLNAMASSDLLSLVNTIVEKEGFDLSDEVKEEVVEAAEGSARKALVILEQVGELGSEKDQLAAIAASTYTKEEAIALARLLCNPGVQWREIAEVLKNLKEQDAEGIRYCVLGYARAILLGGGKLAPRAYMIIDIFSRNFYDSKHAGLAAACWEVNQQT